MGWSVLISIPGVYQVSNSCGLQCVTLLSPQHSAPRLQEKGQIWPPAQMAIHTKNPQACWHGFEVAAMGWSVLTSILVSTKSPTAVGCNVWPCFHLNTPLQGHSKKVRFCSQPKRPSQKHSALQACWHGFEVAAIGWSVLASIPGVYQVSDSFGLQ